MMWLVRIALRFPHTFFSPLAMAVVFTMVASYLFPRTVVPTIVKYLWKTQSGWSGANDQGGGNRA